MKEGRRNWVVVTVLAIPLILIFFIFGPPYYESLDIVGKRAFMLVFQFAFIAIMYPIVCWFRERYINNKDGQD